MGKLGAAGFNEWRWQQPGSEARAGDIEAKQCTAAREGKEINKRVKRSRRRQRAARSRRWGGR
jgi:hypothetical protein